MGYLFMNKNNNQIIFRIKKIYLKNSVDTNVWGVQSIHLN